jgi:UDP-N-acetylmuramoyl-tripeptide--D-alanyl-D-alanine ligase
VSLDEVAEQLESFRAPAMRMEVAHRPDGATILNDTYNAAPDSMRAALDTLQRMAGSRRRAVAVLGEMKELGEYSEEAHRYVGRLAAERGVSLLVTVGSGARPIADAAAESLDTDRILYFESTEAALESLIELVNPGDVVLVKGSRAMQMERIVDTLMSAMENPSA